MKFKSKITLLFSVAVLFAQPCSAQLRSVVETETPPMNRLARLNDDLGPYSGQPKFDRIALNQPGDAPSILSTFENRPDFEAQRAENSHEIHPQEMARIAVKGPNELMTGSACTFVATIENPTSTVFKDLQISLSPDSRFAPASNSKSTLYLEQLDPNYRAQFEFNLMTEKPGIADLEFVTTGKFAVSLSSNTRIQNQTETPGISVSTFHRVQVVSPPSTAELSGPSLLHIGTEADYAIKVINTSERPLHNIQVTLQIPRGLEVTILDRVSEPNPKQRSITWHIPDIKYDHHEVIRFKAQAIGNGQQLSKVSVVMGEQPQGKATLKTEVVGNSKRQSIYHAATHQQDKKPVQNYDRQPK